MAQDGGDAPGGAVTVLAVADTPVERALIDRWVADGGPGTRYPAAGEVTVIPATAEAIAADLLPRDDDPLVLPVTVVWLPAERDGRRRARLADVMLLTNPRNPHLRAQRRIARDHPDRCPVLTGEPATLAQLRTRWAETTARTSPQALARFIKRAAVVALERSERAVTGDRYKVPRLLAEQIMDSEAFRLRLAEIARSTGAREDETFDYAEKVLEELVAVQSRLVTDVFTQMMRPLYGKAWEVDVDESGLAKLRAANRGSSLVFLPSHRSYADAFVLGDVLAENDFPRNHLMGGANLTFWPIGPIARRTGTVFIRRSFGDDRVYKAALEEYFTQLLVKRFNLEWYFEGGRTRTGKLRPPKYGLLAYVANAVRSGRAEDALLVPVSITYERLAEVGAVAAEQQGAPKRPEGLKWLAGYARAQRTRAGTVYVRFGEPLSLRETLAAAGDPDLADPETAPADPGAEPPSVHDRSRLALQKVGFEVAVGINDATPVTVNALVTLALLGVRDRALTVSEVRAVITPVREYIHRRKLPEGELEMLDTDAGLIWVLDRLAEAKVVTVYRGGLEPVYAITPGQHLVAAFYRNSGIHWFVNRAILELSILHIHAGGVTDAARAGWAEALRLRDLLKFEFFFPDKQTFAVQLIEELEMIAPQWRTAAPDSAEALELLVESGFFMAHRTLRSFFGAQQVVAERLLARGDAGVADPGTFLDECVAVGTQMLLQNRVHGPESVSSELFATAWRLAENLELVGGPDVAARRTEFAETVREIGRLIAVAEDLDMSNRKVSR